MTENGSSRGLRRLAVAAMVAIAAALVLVAHPAVAFAGSITITQCYGSRNNPIPGGTVAIYQVGRIDGSQYQYVSPFDRVDDDRTLTARIANNVDVRYLAKLEAIARTFGTPEEKEIGSDGKARFDGLENGAYLVVQTRSAQGYKSFSTFLITVPLDGKEDVDAWPKLDPVNPTPTPPNGNTNNGGDTPSNNTNNGNGNNNTPSNNTNNGNENSNTPGNNTNDNGNTNGNTNTPGNTTNGNTNTTGTPGGGGSTGGGSSTPSGGSSSSSSENLPQTGQLWWPVWVLLICGSVLVVGGLVWRDRHHVDGGEQD